MFSFLSNILNSTFRIIATKFQSKFPRIPLMIQSLKDMKVFLFIKTLNCTKTV